MIKPKHYFMIFIVFMFFSFNYAFYSSLKTHTDKIINTTIMPIASSDVKQSLQLRMQKSLYFPADIDYLNDYSFEAYKKHLLGKDLLSPYIKNVMLLNYKIATNDMVDFSIKSNYLINICMIISFLFAMYFREPITMKKTNFNMDNHYEPTL